MIPTPEQLQALSQAPEGKLPDVPFAALLLGLSIASRTLVVEVRRKQISKRIAFEMGVPIDCRSNLVHETLGRYMVAEGKIQAADLHSYLSQSAGRGQPLGEILLDHGMVTAEELYKLLQQNLAKKLLDVFTWRDGEFRTHTETPRPESPLKIRVPQLIVTGITKFAPQEEVDAGVVPLIGKKLCLHPDPPFALEDIRLNPRQSQVAVALRSGWRIDELALGTGMPFEEITRLLYALAILGVVITSDHPAAKSVLRATRAATSPVVPGLAGGAAAPRQGATPPAGIRTDVGAAAGARADADTGAANAATSGAAARVPSSGIATRPMATMAVPILTPAAPAGAPGAAGAPEAAGASGPAGPMGPTGPTEIEGAAELSAAAATARVSAAPAAPPATAAAVEAPTALPTPGGAGTTPMPPSLLSLVTDFASPAAAPATGGGGAATDAALGSAGSATTAAGTVGAVGTVGTAGAAGGMGSEAAGGEAGRPSAERRNEIMQAYLSYRRQDAFDLLGTDEDASPAAIEGSYLEFARRFAPWTLVGPQLAGMEEKARDLFLAGARAYSELLDLEQRNALLFRRKAKREERDRRSPADMLAIKTDLLDPEVQYRKGRALMDAGKFQEAAVLLEFASDCDPQNGLYSAELAYCRYCASPSQAAKALKELQETLRRDPECGLAVFYSGEIHRQLGNRDDAEKMLRRAIKMMAPDRRPIEALKTLSTEKRK